MVARRRPRVTECQQYMYVVDWACIPSKRRPARAALTPPAPPNKHHWNHTVEWTHTAQEEDVRPRLHPAIGPPSHAHRPRVPCGQGLCVVRGGSRCGVQRVPCNQTFKVRRATCAVPPHFQGVACNVCRAATLSRCDSGSSRPTATLHTPALQPH